MLDKMKAFKNPGKLQLKWNQSCINVENRKRFVFIGNINL